MAMLPVTTVSHYVVADNAIQAGYNNYKQDVVQIPTKLQKKKEQNTTIKKAGNKDV